VLLHGCDVPSEHVPFAPFTSQPWHESPVTRFVVPQVSAHGPAVVKHPPGEQPATQHCPGVVPAAHAVSAGVQEQMSQSPRRSHRLVQVASA
jgi:hypothetical protein